MDIFGQVEEFLIIEFHTYKGSSVMIQRATVLDSFKLVPMF